MAYDIKVEWDLDGFSEGKAAITVSLPTTPPAPPGVLTVMLNLGDAETLAETILACVRDAEEAAGVGSEEG